MRKIELLNDNWTFLKPGQESEKLNLPHSWNGVDGQDGRNDYLRTTCKYTKKFNKPDVKEGEICLVQFRGANSESEVFLNDVKAGTHEGGYSTFNVDITKLLIDGENTLEVKVCNAKNDHVYPQRADFTFYGGIYRDVYLIVLPKDRFDFGPDASPPLKLTPKVEGKGGLLTVEAYAAGGGDVEVTVLAQGKVVASGELNVPIKIPNVHLWNGLIDPFLYMVKAELKINGNVVDTVTERTGFRTFYVDSEKGFFLNGKHYPLRGVCRHQDRPKIGNAISKADQDEDMHLIMEIGANTIRLAHYQHDQYFYNLCDEVGQIVWAEIPYISEYLPNGNESACNQIRELVRQNYNHPSIICWGVSNEIMIKRMDPAPIVENHKQCHAICKAEDPSRPTVVACYAVTGNNHPTAHVTDLVSWNLYYGWYVPNFLFFHFGMRMDGFRKKYKKIPLGLSEYGAEGMPNLHAAKPKRLDNTEEYQAIYHEKNMAWVNKRDYLWATHIWNMFDFGSDGRNQGGEPGMNHKGLITCDRKTKKDAFYFYKALWSKEKFVHIAGRRYTNRTGNTLKIKVYSNCGEVTLYRNGKKFQTQKGDKEFNKIFNFVLPSFAGKEEITVKCESCSCSDNVTFQRANKPDLRYKLSKNNKGNNMSWEK